jgi:outer membrane protein assembly factor BamE (lipoprotein component of BamABCDE complex)
MRRRPTLYIPISIAVLSFVAFVYWAPIDGWIGNLFLAVDGEDTEWALGYSDDAFRVVHIGMSRKEVYAILGKPFETWSWVQDEVYEAWTRSPGDTNFRQRQVIFKGDRVIGKTTAVYVD